MQSLHAYGSAQFETGPREISTIQGADNSTKFGKGLTVFQRLHLGFRAMLADRFGSGQHTVERDNNTLRMTDMELFRDLRSALREQSSPQTTPSAAAQRVMKKFDDALLASSLDSGEKQALKRVVDLVLKVGTASSLSDAEYQKRLTDLHRSDTLDTQYEKVREDAKHRWIGFLQNTGVAVIAKSLAAASASTIGFLGGVFAVGAAETAV